MPFAAHDQQSREPEQCRFAARIALQRPLIGLLGRLDPAGRTQCLGKPQRRLVPLGHTLLGFPHQL
jgi:hypothetical protein